MTFSLPAKTARRFIKHVPASERSRYVARLIERSFHIDDQALIEACRAVNRDRAICRLGKELDALGE